MNRKLSKGPTEELVEMIFGHIIFISGLIGIAIGLLIATIGFIIYCLLT